MLPNSRILFEAALGNIAPWHIREIEFKNNESNIEELHIHLDFQRGTKFSNDAGELKVAYDCQPHTWRHLDFFQHKCYLHAPVPRIEGADGKPAKVSPPWARRNGGFTLLFEAYVMSLLETNNVSVLGVARLVKETDKRIWRIFDHYVRQAHAQAAHDAVKKVGLDETSSRKGHRYVTVGVDLEKNCVFQVAEGKGMEAVQELADYLEEKGSAPSQVEQVSIDMSPAFIAGVMESFPEADITFDRFHLEKEVSKALDEVRRLEQKECKLLKGHKYTFLKNPENLKDKRKKELNELLTLYPTIGECYRIKQLFKEFWEFTDQQLAIAFLYDWCLQAEATKAQPFIRVVAMIKRHWTGTINYVQSQINNGVLEGINSKIQLAKRTARGYRNMTNFKNMILFLCGKLQFNYP